MWWQFRVHRPFLLLICGIDLIVLVALIILALLHVRMSFWITDTVSSVIASNLVALWRDGVN